MLTLKATYEVKEEQVLERLKLILKKSMFKMEELAVKNAPFDQGELRNKISVEPKGLSDRYVLTSKANHSEDMEYGSEPFYADIDDLIGWARRKGKDEGFAYAVQEKIAKVGVRAQPFLRPAFSQVKDYWLPLFMRETFDSQTDLNKFS